MAGEVKGLSSLIAKLRAFDAAIENAAGQCVLRTAQKAAADARKLAPSNKHSQAGAGGAVSLRGSITHKVERKVDGVVGIVETNAPHAAFVEFGTGPVGAANHGGISPNVSPSYTSRESWVYPYEGPEGTEFVTTSGQPARPYLYPAAVQNKSTFEAEAKAAYLAAARKGGR